MTAGPIPDPPPTAAPAGTGARPRPGPATGTLAAAALAADVLLVLAFVLIGRGSHHSGGGLAGFADTALPFLAGTVIGWLLGRAWIRPLAVIPTGVVVWAATVIGGLAIRATRGGGFAVSFAIVTTIVLAAFLIGWRLLAVVVRRRGWSWSARRPRRSGR